MHGIYTALITPFGEDYHIDWLALKHLLDIQNALQAVQGYVALGSTAEQHALTMEEKQAIVEFLCQHTAKPIIVNLADLNPQKVLELLHWCEQKPIAGYLLPSPPYSKPSQDALYEYFTWLANQTKKPCLLYDIPSRTGVKIEPHTVARCAKHPQIIGIKDASGDMRFLTAMQTLIQEPFLYFSGDDPSLFHFFMNQGHGCISVASHVFAPTIHHLQLACESGQNKLAHQLHLAFVNQFETLFLQSNPVPLKFLLSLLGVCKPTVRRPLLPLDTQYHSRLKTMASHIKGTSV